MNTLLAVYLVENQELMLQGGVCYPVPPAVAKTVTPAMLDLRFVKRWACMKRLLPDGADIGVCV